MRQVHPDYNESSGLVVDGSIRIAADDNPVLIGTECSECEYVVFPSRPFCRNCLSDNVSDVELARTGQLETYTVAHTGQEGIEPPYAFGFVNLENVQIYSRFTEWKERSLEVGDQVELVLEKIKTDTETGEPLFGHMFRPMEEEQ
ncbi:Zn-ribbon domain-containing OB-fold protein [Halomarina salina]|jgi:uncharacterized OB-fold protein|uniref:Zn-ribbon domain-containing OB-fold protein n=1 Tax=Halomarina salina TaxID=1872699 RepID=A0ABD5RTM7_9EURY|nr:MULTISPECIES: OB-fold domain-containing protein [Haloarculaceae]